MYFQNIKTHKMIMFTTLLFIMILFSGCDKKETKTIEEYKCPDTKNDIDCVSKNPEPGSWCHEDFRKWATENCDVKYIDWVEN